MSEQKPTVVLVHGAFADAGSFAAVIPLLLADGIKVVAPAVPNRSLIGDSAYIASSSARSRARCCWPATPTAAR